MSLARRRWLSWLSNNKVNWDFYTHQRLYSYSTYLSRNTRFTSINCERKVNPISHICAMYLVRICYLSQRNNLSIKWKGWKACSCRRQQRSNLISLISKSGWWPFIIIYIDKKLDYFVATKAATSKFLITIWGGGEKSLKEALDGNKAVRHQDAICEKRSGREAVVESAKSRVVVLRCCCNLEKRLPTFLLPRRPRVYL